MKLFIILLIIIIIFLLFKKKEKYTEEYILPKKIYTYWHDGLNGDDDNKKIIRTCYETWLRNIRDWEIILLTNSNLGEYVSKDFLRKYEKLDKIKFSDFLRLELLKNNGGVWMDISTIIINSEFLNNFRNEMIKNYYDVTVYELVEKSNSKENPYLENWFIMAKQNSKYITDLYNEFDKAYKMGFHNYKSNILIPSKVNLKGTLEYDSNIYLMQHAIINYLIHMNKKYNINIKDSSDGMFKVHHMLNWDNNKISNFLINNKNWNNIYAIKLINRDRKYIINNNTSQFINNINLIK